MRWSIIKHHNRNRIIWTLWWFIKIIDPSVSYRNRAIINVSIDLKIPQDNYNHIPKKDSE